MWFKFFRRTSIWSTSRPHFRLWRPPDGRAGLPPAESPGGAIYRRPDRRASSSRWVSSWLSVGPNRAGDKTIDWWQTSTDHYIGKRCISGFVEAEVSADDERQFAGHGLEAAVDLSGHNHFVSVDFDFRSVGRLRPTEIGGRHLRRTIRVIIDGLFADDDHINLLFGRQFGQNLRDMDGL